MKKKVKDEIELLILDLLNDGYVGDKVEKIIYKIIGEKGMPYKEISFITGDSISRITHEDRIKKLEEITEVDRYKTKLIKENKKWQLKQKIAMKL